LKSGDLLFQVNESNDFTDAITSSTGDKSSYSFSHVGIVAREESELFVIEAVPGDGVRKVSLDEFLESSAKSPDGKALVVAYRVKVDKNVQLTQLKELKVMLIILMILFSGQTIRHFTAANLFTKVLSASQEIICFLSTL
jgi:hypothetical protein